jgi:phosphoenolpyruvate carboxykinase (GTP)
VPRREDLDLDGLDGMTDETWEKLMHIDVEEWRREVLSQDELFLKLYGDLPKEIIFERELLVTRL